MHLFYLPNFLSVRKLILLPFEVIKKHHLPESTVMKPDPNIPTNTSTVLTQKVQTQNPLYPGVYLR